MRTLITGIGQLVSPRGRGPVGGKGMKELHVRDGVEILIEDGRISRIARSIPAGKVDRTIEAAGMVAIPGLVDPHTHAVFAGTREDEFLARVHGVPYDGGGILETTRAVRKTPEEELARNARAHLKRMLSAGTTTVEIKSGYGLSPEDEIKLLLAVRRVRRSLPVRIVSTFLGAHAFPPDVRRDDYISMIITEMIPTVRRRRLAQFCDVFCDKGFYTISETRTILRAARGAGLRLKLHADELEASGGAELAAELSATSADHLLKVTDRGMRKLQTAGVIPVLLPGTAFSLQTEYAPARRMIELGLPVALGTDFNPGTCLISSMFIIIGLAVMRMGMTIEEAITAATLNAAAALELADEIGSLEEGKAADILLLELENYRQIPYFFGHNPVKTVICGGKVVHEAKW